MTTYNVTLTQTEDKALSSEVLSQAEWIQNAAQERSRVAIEGIVASTVQRCLAQNTQIPATKEEIVDLAFANGWVKTAAERNAELEAVLAAQQS